MTALLAQEGGTASATKEAKSRTWVRLFVSFNLKTSQGLNVFEILTHIDALVNQE